LPVQCLHGGRGESLSSFGQLRRFLKPLAVRVARSVTEVEVAHHARRHHVRSSSPTRLRGCSWIFS
jgi:hypothetical protein